MTTPETRPIFSKSLDKALHFAARAHATQVRKGTDIPYVTHPVAVAWSLNNAGESEEVVIAALLHDTVEDTDTTLLDVEEHFGQDVATLVDAVTERKTDSTGQERSWLERKTEQLAHLADTTDDRIVALKAADATHNIWSMVQDHETHGAAIWKRFHAGPDAQLWRYEQLVATVQERLGPQPLTLELEAAVEAFRRIASS